MTLFYLKKNCLIYFKAEKFSVIKSNCNQKLIRKFCWLTAKKLCWQQNETISDVRVSYQFVWSQKTMFVNS